jgi:hypothetical protein
VIAIYANTRNPLIGPYVRGQLVLQHVDPRIPLDAWLDAVHAIVATTPTDVLKKINDNLTVNAAMADPEGARESWGLLPEHQINTPAEKVFQQD